MLNRVVSLNNTFHSEIKCTPEFALNNFSDKKLIEKN